MVVIQEPILSNNSECAYIEDRQWRFEYFFAFGLTGSELEKYLESGWRKFGVYYFKPKCDECFGCIPIRVSADRFKPSRSQKRVIKKNSEIIVNFAPLKFSEEIYEIYRDHSINRFGKETDVEDFMTNFYSESCPSLQSEYYLND